MHDIQFFLLLLIAAAVLVRLADVVSVPSPIVLVIGGLGIALIPGLPRVELPPEAIFLLFLPPLVHASGWTSSPQELRAVARPLAVLSIALVLVTAAVVAVVAHALVPDMSWAAAAVLGGVLAPTDAVAATSVLSRLGAPERLRLVVTGESMINDGTGLVVYRIAVGVATGAAFSAGGAVLQFLGNSLGGVAVGVAVGALETVIIRRQSDAALTIVITVLAAYGAYIGAEELHASGILAAVVSGVYGGYRASRAMDADTRLTGLAFWQVMTFALEITLFVLVGLQLPAVVEALNRTSTSAAELILPSLGIAAASLVVRMAAVFALRTDIGETWRERLVSGWAGMRGAVSLAAALAVPLEVDERPQIVFLTFALILVTLVGQGLTLPALMRSLNLREDRRWSEEEAAARMEAAQAALDRLDEIEDEERASEPQLGRLRNLYRSRFRVCMAVLGGEEPAAAQRQERTAHYGQLRRELITIERDTLVDLRAQGRLRNGTLRQIERDLDLEEARVRG